MWPLTVRGGNGRISSTSIRKLSLPSEAAVSRKIRRWGIPFLAVGAAAALVPLALPAHAAATRYEAESATLSQAVVATNHTGFTGTGFVDYTNVAGGFIEWSVSAAAAGPATAVLRYANGTTGNRPMDVTVNGAAAASGLPFAPTANWDTWADVSINVTLNAGTNAIRATATGATRGPNGDKLTLPRAGTAGPDTPPPV